MRRPDGCRRRFSGWHSIRVNDQWRLCFHRAGEDALEVEIVDTH